MAENNYKITKKGENSMSNLQVFKKDMGNKNWDIAIENFIMENEVLKFKDFSIMPKLLGLPLGMLFLLCCALVITTEGVTKEIFIMCAGAMVIVCLIAVVFWWLLACIDKKMTASLINKKKYTYGVETCVKVLKSGNEYHIETDKQNLYVLKNEASVNEKLLVLKVGKISKKVYTIKQVSAELKELMAL